MDNLIYIVDDIHTTHISHHIIVFIVQNPDEKLKKQKNKNIEQTYQAFCCISAIPVYPSF